MLALAIFLLQPAAPATCSAENVSDLFEAKRWRQVEALAPQCGPRDPIYYFFAAQAQEKQRKWAPECKSLRSFLKSGPSGRNRTEAEQMLEECEPKERAAQEKAARNKAARDKVVQQVESGAAEEGPTPERLATPPVDKPPPEGVAPLVQAKAVEAPPPEVEAPPPEEVKPPARDRRRQRLWLGVGIVAGTSALASVTAGISGYYGYTKEARTTNDGYLKEYGLDPSLDPDKCTGPQCGGIQSLEAKYPSSEYYTALRDGLLRESAATALGGVSLGLVLSTLPELVRKEGGRRFGLGAMIVAGAALVAGGAAWTSAVQQDVGARLEGHHPDDNTSYWRAGSDYDAVRRNHLLSSALTGVGVGLVVGGSTSAVVRWHDKPGASDRRASLRVSPTLGGLMLLGRF